MYTKIIHLEVGVESVDSEGNSDKVLYKSKRGKLSLKRITIFLLQRKTFQI